MLPKVASLLFAAAIMTAASHVDAAPVTIPAPSARPQDIAPGSDTFLRALADRTAAPLFSARVTAAADSLPVLGERLADVAAARAQRDQARSRLFPGIGLDLVASRTIARDLQLPTTQVENLSPLRRNDAIGSVEQLITDFGASSARIRAGNAATDAARADLDATRNTALLQLVGSWYDVLAAQTAMALAQSHVERMQVLADGAALRFATGVDSGGDVARARSYLAAAQGQKIGFDRRLRSAEARYLELFGTLPGAVARPDIGAGPSAGEGAVRPELVAARFDERAAAAALDAARADRLPRLDARISSAGYDVLRGTAPAYDVRAQLTLRQRFSTGGAEAARVAELAARRRSAAFAVDRIAAATDRELGVAAADVDGLADSVPPLERAYLDSRRARDLYAEQFRVSRGTLFDVLRAERDLLEAALVLARANYELDVARFTLLARQGGLIERFGMVPAVIADKSEAH
ncbi:MAG: hypothetical protein DCF31_05080 [Alphaproteobacteria bacterium]|nr:MAG: hypothetical protein DCF31_05080 [Alphaproteobacteria bacterium]